MTNKPSESLNRLDSARMCVFKNRNKITKTIMCGNINDRLSQGKCHWFPLNFKALSVHGTLSLVTFTLQGNNTLIKTLHGSVTDTIRQLNSLGEQGNSQ